ncbi:aldo/keto reductase [Uliginosibacterium gangwonense]|uniref:aldo/keto reductase n=1 Tax=Uliginosibacterium gangwonense TaxID=392736 RepID=UPI0003690118|nr:aldo/keto reductase [Uliginosibacterium gangwonense]
MALPVALGTVNFGTSIDKEHCFQVLDMFQSLGGTRIDTADNYAFWHPQGQGGESERVIGAWLADKNRSDFEIITKIGAQSLSSKTFDNLTGLSAAAVLRAVEGSLYRLGTSYIDVLFAHLDDPHTSLLETWQAMSQLVASGKVRKLGISNYSTQRVKVLDELIVQHGLEPVSYAQYRHTVIPPVPGADFAPQIAIDDGLLAQLRNMSAPLTIMAYSPLLDGHLAVAGAELPAQYDSAANREAVAAMGEEARSRNASLAAVVLERLCQQGFLPITATGNAQRLRENLKLLC